ncbi:SAM-dependent methyltransferase [Streptomyces sp. NPDC054796]
MERQRLSSLAHRDHPVASPLDDTSVRTLLQRALPDDGGGERLLDLGCGEGEWLARALAGRPGARGEGVDVSAIALTEARRSLDAAGVGDRATLHQGDAREFTSPHRYDLVLCVGSTHAFGGLLPTLEAARGHLAAGGSVLVGEGFWERPPTPATLAELGAEADDYDDLATTVDRVTADGWVPVYGHVSSLAEWDAYEWSWTGSLSRWALANPTDPDSAAALNAAHAHRDGWLHTYRGTFGFVTLLLRGA